MDTKSLENRIRDAEKSLQEGNTSLAEYAIKEAREELENLKEQKANYDRAQGIMLVFFGFFFVSMSCENWYLENINWFELIVSGIAACLITHGIVVWIPEEIANEKTITKNKYLMALILIFAGFCGYAVAYMIKLK